MHYYLYKNTNTVFPPGIPLSTSTYTCTFDCIRSLSAINSADPFPARAIPFTKAVDAPDPIPNVKHLQDYTKIFIITSHLEIHENYPILPNTQCQITNIQNCP